MAGKPETVKVGSIRIPIYENQSGGYRSYTVAFYLEGKRQRRTFSDPEEAREEAKTIARSIAAGNARATDLTAEERDMLRRAQDRLHPLGIPLDEAIWEYVQAKNLVNGGSLLPAAQNYARSFIGVEQGILVSKAAEECLQAKRDRGLSDRYIKQLESDLRRISEAFPKAIGEVSSTEMEEWLSSLAISNRPKNNFIGSLSTFFHFAKKRRWLPEDRATEADRLEKFNVTEAANVIYTPTQMNQLLTASTGEQTIWLAIGGFGGLRAAEIMRLEWPDINFESGFITVSAENAKTSARRLVPISKNLRKWLAPFAQKEGRLLKDLEIWKDVTALAKKIGLG